MSNLKGKRGSWINQFAQPSHQLFIQRGKQVDYVVIKYGMATYEVTALQFGIPWLAERMGESGVGAQNGPAHAAQYAQELAAQANQPGCIGAVLNLEEADGGWHTDEGWSTITLIKEFQRLAPGAPLFASLDTRGNRPNYPYQRACAALCDGVMPMVYPKAFGLSASASFASAITPLLRERWAGKDILPTYQTYDGADVPSQVAELDRLYSIGHIAGANSYTLGHASGQQWQQSLAFAPVAPPPPPATAPDLRAALVAMRTLWVNGWHAIEQSGTVGEAVAFADFWKRLTGA
jgi:hypothetical protein